MWDEITYPLPNLKGATVKVGEFPNLWCHCCYHRNHGVNLFLVKVALILCFYLSSLVINILWVIIWVLDTAQWGNKMNICHCCYCHSCYSNSSDIVTPVMENHHASLKRKCHFDETLIAGCTGSCHLTISDAANNEHVIKMTTSTFQWSPWQQYVTVVTKCH